MAGRAREGFAGRLRSAAAAVHGRALATRATMAAAAAGQMRTARSTFAATRGRVGTVVEAARAGVRATMHRQEAALAAAGRGQVTRLTSELTAQWSRVRELGSEYDQRARLTAVEGSRQLAGAFGRRARQAREIGRRLAVANSSAEVREAKRRVSIALGEETAVSIIDALGEAPEEMRASGVEAGRGFRQQGDDAAHEVTDAQLEILAQLSEMFASARSSIRQVGNQADQQLVQLHAQARAQLMRSEASVIAQLTAQLRQRERDLDAVSASGIAALYVQGAKALLAGDGQIAKLNLHIAGAQLLTPQLPPLAGEIGAWLGSAYSGLGGEAEAAAAGLSGEIRGFGQRTMAAIAGVIADLTARAAAFLGSIARGTAVQREMLSSGLDAVTAGVVASATRMIGQVGGQLARGIADLGRSFGQALDQFRTDLAVQIHDGDVTAREPLADLPDLIREVQRRAEEREGMSWLEEQWADFKEAISDPGFIAGLIVGVIAAIVTIILLPEALALGAVLLIAAAVGGFVGGFVGSLVSQAAAHGWDWSKVSVRQALLSGFVGAASSVVLAAAIIYGPAWLGSYAGISLMSGALTVVTNLITGERWSKNLLGNMLLAPLLARVLKSVPAPRRVRGPLSVRTRLPQGLSETQFRALSRIVRAKAQSMGLGDDIFVHGSRASGTARPNSDIDIAIRVPPELWEQFLNTRSRIANPNPGSNLAATRANAIRNGIIQRGEARLSGTGRQLEQLLGIEVDLSVVRAGGPFDTGPRIFLIE